MIVITDFRLTSVYLIPPPSPSGIDNICSVGDVSKNQPTNRCRISRCAWTYYRYDDDDIMKPLHRFLRSMRAIARDLRFRICRRTRMPSRLQQKKSTGPDYVEIVATAFGAMWHHVRAVFF